MPDSIINNTNLQPLQMVATEQVADSFCALRKNDFLLSADSANVLQLVATQEPPRQLEAKPLGNTLLGVDNQWILYIVLCVVVVLGVIRVRSQEFFVAIFSSVTVNSNWRALRSNADIRYFWPLRICRFVALGIFSLYAYEVFVAQGYKSFFGFEHIEAFGAMFLAVYAFYLLRNILDIIIGFAFDKSKFAIGFRQAKSLSLSVYAVVALPFVLLFPFASERFYMFFSVVALVLAVAGFLIRFIRSFQIISLNMVSLSYYILYLCSVEIAPLLCFLKAVKMGLI